MKIFDQEDSSFPPHMNREEMIRAGLKLLNSLRKLFPGSYWESKIQ